MGREKTLALGVYPDVGLKEARAKRFEARKLHAAGIDPGAKKQEDKQIALARTENSFQAVAEQWFKDNSAKWSKENGPRMRIWRLLERNVLSYLGNQPIAEIKPLELLKVVKVVEKRGATDLSRRVLRICGQVFRYAVAHGKVQYNIAADLSDALVAHKVKHHPAISTKELPRFFAELEATPTSLQNKLCIRLLALTFLRQGEFRHAKWEDVDFVTKEWRIPA